MKLPEKPPDISAVSHTGLIERVLALGLGPDTDGRYLAWDEIRRHEPPDGFTSVQWWAALSLVRRLRRQALPLIDARGESFGFVVTDEVNALLHQIDQTARTDLQELNERGHLRQERVGNRFVFQAKAKGEKRRR